MLLTARLHFRYNQVFAVHAAEFAQAAVVLRSPAQSLRFIVRQGHLVCSIDDSLGMLRSLVLGGHPDHAERLFRELRTRFWAAYDAGTATYENVVDQMTAMYIFAAAGRDTLESVISELRFLDRLLFKNLKAAGASEDERREYRSAVYGTMGGEILWSRGFAVTRAQDPVELAIIIETAERLTRRYGSHPAEPARPAVQEPYKALDKAELAEALRHVASDKDLSGDDGKLIARALMRSSDAFDLVRELYVASLPLVVEANLRAENGVDLSWEAVELVRGISEVHGFTADPSVSNRLAVKTRHAWENRLLGALSWLGEANGRLYMSRAQRQSAAGSFIAQVKGDLLPLVSFPLAERAEWEDSYHLPEGLLPEIFEYAAIIVTVHDPASAPELADLILDHGESQFGLYTEGYTRLLGSVANALATVPAGIVPAADIRRTMHEHLERKVFARRERVAGLLDCAQHLGRLGAEESAERAFQDAIDSSLGPNWYKEGQFQLIIDALEGVDEAEFSASRWKSTVEILAYASGESTFQRYVRDAKAALIGHLASIGRRAEALATYWHYLLPSYELQKLRIRAVDVDMTTDVSGGRFGVQEVEEQWAALELLSGLDGASPLRRWAVLELFWPWGDDRDSDRFAAIFSGLLATDKSNLIGERFLRLLRAGRCRAPIGVASSLTKFALRTMPATPRHGSPGRLSLVSPSSTIPPRPRSRGLEFFGSTPSSYGVNTHAGGNR